MNIRYVNSSGSTIDKQSTMQLKNPARTSPLTDIEKQRQLDKIRLLEEELNRLNILENPLEIKNICNSIINLKNKLEKSS